MRRFFPQSFEELLGVVSELSSGRDAVAVQAGHFLLSHDEARDRLIPCIDSELVEQRYSEISAEVGRFPTLTWGLGVELLRSLCKVKTRRILTVVNDWQYVPKSVDRGGFYRTQKGLPVAYEGMLKGKGPIEVLRPADLGFKTGTGLFFSERTLRNQYVRFAKKLAAAGGLPNINGNGRCSIMSALGRKQEVYCPGHEADCAQEIAELVRQVVAIGGHRLFVNFFPLMCKDFVEQGVELAGSLVRQNGSASAQTAVLSVGMPASGIRDVEDLFTACECFLHTWGDGSDA